MNHTAENMRSSYADGNFDRFSASSSWRLLERGLVEEALRGKISVATRVLDLGHGGGRVCQLLLDMGASEERIRGVDLSAELTALARERYPQAHLEVQDILETTPAPSSLDVVVSVFVMQYFNATNMCSVIEHMYTGLVPGGRLAFLVPHADRIISTSDGKQYGDGYYMVNTPFEKQLPNYAHTPEDYKSFFPADRWTVEISNHETPDTLKQADPRYADVTGWLRTVITAQKLD